MTPAIFLPSFLSLTFQFAKKAPENVLKCSLCLPSKEFSTLEKEREPCLKMYFARNSVLIRLPWSAFLGGCHAEVVGWQPCVQHSQNKVFSLNLQCNRKLRLNLLMPLEGGVTYICMQLFSEYCNECIYAHTEVALKLNTNVPWVCILSLSGFFIRKLFHIQISPVVLMKMLDNPYI